MRAALHLTKSLVFGCLVLGCAARPGRTGGATPTAATSGRIDPTQASTLDPTQGAPKEALGWAPFDAALFARAKKENKLVVLDGAAEWCHWCHVMEATTYHDPHVRELLGARFLAAKVDVDSRPDIEERYGDYGWPATVIFSPDGRELGKYRGYIAPDAFVEILQTAATAKADGAPASRWVSPGRGPLGEDELAWIERSVVVSLGDFYDDENGGWGRTQKTAIAVNNAWLLALARSGDAQARSRVLFTLDKQRAIVDPVWGGIYQYSAAADWDHPHFEKLMPFQSGALENYAEAFAMTHDARWLATARAMRSYIDAFLLGPDGGFYATQDADVNAHDASKPFMNGHDYYPLNDAGRRAHGIPRVDTHEYGKENGLAIAAYVTLSQATGDLTALATAERAARHVLETHATGRGGITHDVSGGAGDKPALHLADNALFGLALMRLYEATKKTEWLDAAAKIAEVMIRELGDAEGGGFYASTLDPDAVGVFAVRREPFEENVAAMRFLARLAKQTKDPKYAKAIAGTLRAVATPDAIDDRGRMIGDFLLALEETRGVR